MDVSLGNELLEQLADAGKELVAGAQNRRDGRAALLLYHGGVTLASLKAYDYECRAAYKPLLDYNWSWSPARRREAMARLWQFTEVRKIYPLFGEHLTALRSYVRRMQTGALAPVRRVLTPNEQQEAAGRLVDAASEYQQLMIAVVKTKGQWQPSIEYYRFWRKDQVRRHAEAIYNPIKEKGWPLLDTAGDAYGLFQDRILDRHTRLIGWKQTVIDLSGFPEF